MHSGLEKKFPSYFNSFKMPEGAREESIEVHRACKTQKAEEPSFLPSFEENSFQVLDGDPEELGNYSLSTYEKPKHVKRFAALDGHYQPPWKIAIGRTEPCCGLAQRTREREKWRKDSHVDWWLYKNACPHEHFELIEDFSTYLANYELRNNHE